MPVGLERAARPTLVERWLMVACELCSYGSVLRRSFTVSNRNRHCYRGRRNNTRVSWQCHRSTGPAAVSVAPLVTHFGDTLDRVHEVLEHLFVDGARLTGLELRAAH